MTGRGIGVVATALTIVSLVAACGSASQPPGTPTPHPTLPPNATPSPTPLPAGPYAVSVTNSGRTGTTYGVLIIAASGTVVAHVTARLPLLKANQTVKPALVSVSNTLVYYREGDTDIMSLALSGSTALVKSIPAGSTSILAFAVSADDTRIAVSLINQSPSPTFKGSTSHGYVENLVDGANRVDLWSNTDADALRLPVGWAGNNIIDQVGFRQCAYNVSASCENSATSYHVINAAEGSRSATVCEAPTDLPLGYHVYDWPDGLPSTSGVACLESVYDARGDTPVNTYSVYAVDWSGVARTFLRKALAPTDYSITLSSCFLSPDGTRIACADSRSRAITLLTPDGQTHGLGRVFTILGWIDTSHLLVDVDQQSLAIFSPDSGNVTSMPLAQADKVEMDATLPGTH